MGLCWRCVRDSIWDCLKCVGSAVGTFFGMGFGTAFVAGFEMCWWDSRWDCVGNVPSRTVGGTGLEICWGQQEVLGWRCVWGTAG